MSKTTVWTKIRRGASSRLLPAYLALMALSACQSGPAGQPLNLKVAAASPVSALQTINEAAVKCWHKSGDRAFRDLRTIPELDTSAGNPRLLVVQAGKAQGLPSLVIEASGDPVTISTYGPLATTVTGGRINRDIERWSTGPADCRA